MKIIDRKIQFERHLAEIQNCILKDRLRLSRRLKKLTQTDTNAISGFERELQAALAKRKSREVSVPDIHFPSGLPICDKLDEIAETIANNQVTVICGETGSGKTTQLPKLCLKSGRGIDGMIGHTQPRRIAARSVSSRIAQELDNQYGKLVAYKIRHNDQSSDQTLVKLMTDGILLAELQSDRYLNSYDTLIIDEAHERSLNIDFILGYLKQLLPRRPDLKIIITSATIDVQRFSEYFDNAPIVNISGRSYPVEVRYRPAESDDEDDEYQEEYQPLLRAVQELISEGPGDILVFLEGEREIHEASRFLQGHSLGNSIVLPLYSRLSSARQAKIFQPHQKRHIILATNIAETSLTLPDIRYVIDRGLVRISRYNRRSKVQQLPVEKISRASANQRTGRCGRVAEGICIRLYAEEDFDTRTEYTDPEILRTNLASVILQMKALKLGDIRDFPFVDNPDPRYINDGIRLLQELRALDDEMNLTRLGKRMARLPLDPRWAAILLAAGQYQCVSEILKITSALSVQEMRERPDDAKQKADEAHKVFMDEKSDFLFYINLWNYYQGLARKLSQNQLGKWCRQNFISYVRMREWREVHSQLHSMIAETGIYINQQPAVYEPVHNALMHGLLGQVAVKTDEKLYTGARGIKLGIFPGSGQFQKLPKWIMAGELVETRKLYARTVANIKPEWIIKPAEHLLKREWFSPFWDQRSGQVLAHEKVTLYGLVLVGDQIINYGKVKQGDARDIFIREALVNEKYQCKHPFYIHNHQIIEQVKLLEHKSRRHDVYNEEGLFDFYQRLLPLHVCNGPLFEQWYKKAALTNPGLLCIEQDTIMYHDANAVTDDIFPDVMVVNNMSLPLTYRFEPDTESDGVNIDVPLTMLNQISPNQLDYLVPGLFEEKINWLLKSLPKSIRKKLVPIPETARECVGKIIQGDKLLTDTLSDHLLRYKGVKITQQEWNTGPMPGHLAINIRVIDGETVIAQSRNLQELKSKLSSEVSNKVRNTANTGIERHDISSWDFPDLPEVINLEINGVTISSYPALVDHGETVSIQLFDIKDQSRIAMQFGLRRLFMLECRKEFLYLEKNLPDIDKIRLLYMPVGDIDDLTTGILELAASESFLFDSADIRSRELYNRRLDMGIKHLVDNANELCRVIHKVLNEYNDVKKLLDSFAHATGIFDDINHQLENLVYDGFIGNINVNLLKEYPRYLSAIKKRMEKHSYSPEKDARNTELFSPYWEKYREFRQYSDKSDMPTDEIDNYRWMLEEYRISLFAQEMKTRMPVSPRRLDKQIEQIRKMAKS